jgi:hypothetical protein
MILKTRTELTNTRAKLADLERLYAAAKQRPVNDPHARSLTLRSLSATIKHLKEEIALFETRASTK